jgi:dihydroorotate dehydrogenase
MAFDFYPLVGPMLARMADAEVAHRFTLLGLRTGLVPAPVIKPDPILETRAFGLTLANPLGLAAGFDKNGEVPDQMRRFGFGLVEVGSVTPRPQAGNPRPRLFRLAEDRAVINRMGFNNDGHAALLARLQRRNRRGVLGVNLGANKDSADPIADYEAGIRIFAPYAEYLVINISSPNTPGLRDLQGRARLDALLARLLPARDGAGRVPLLLKVAPDLAAEDKADIAELALHHGIDGLIVSNTTIARPASLQSRARSEAGGLSGAPLMAPSTAALTDFYRLTQGRLPLVGVGGIASGADAYAKIRAGASVLQLYSALVFAGPFLVGRILADLAARLRADGFSTMQDAIGAGLR